MEYIMNTPNDSDIGFFVQVEFKIFGQGKQRNKKFSTFIWK